MGSQKRYLKPREFMDLWRSRLYKPVKTGIAFDDQTNDSPGVITDGRNRLGEYRHVQNRLPALLPVIPQIPY